MAQLSGAVTDFNKYNPYPYIATIRCPSCDGRAEFRKAFALVQQRHWSYWEPRLWACGRATSWDRDEQWAPGDPAPAWRGWIIIEQDPALFRWKQPPSGYHDDDRGVVSCARCVGRRRHTLRWPADAHYRFELPEGVLWAWSREGAEALIAYIDSTDRRPGEHGRGQYLFLRHIPTVFLRAKNRARVVRRLRRTLDELA